MKFQIFLLLFPKKPDSCCLLWVHWWYTALISLNLKYQHDRGQEDSIGFCSKFTGENSACSALYASGQYLARTLCLLHPSILSTGKKIADVLKCCKNHPAFRQQELRSSSSWRGFSRHDVPGCLLVLLCVASAVSPSLQNSDTFLGRRSLCVISSWTQVRWLQLFLLSLPGDCMDNKPVCDLIFWLKRHSTEKKTPCDFLYIVFPVTWFLSLLMRTAYRVQHPPDFCGEKEEQKIKKIVHYPLIQWQNYTALIFCQPTGFFFQYSDTLSNYPIADLVHSVFHWWVFIYLGKNNVDFFPAKGKKELAWDNCVQSYGNFGLCQGYCLFTVVIDIK